MSIISLIVTLLIFTVVVVVHEFGHFLAARKNGIMVEEFAVGMGPIILKKQSGDTLYTIRAFPIGGFCKMLGEENGNDDERSFSNKKVWQRIIVCLAGVIMNLVLAVILAAMLFSFVSFSSTVVHSVSQGSPASEIGILPGDKILEVNGKSILIYEYLPLTIEKVGANETTIKFKRGSETITKNFTPMQAEGRFLLGVTVEGHVGMFVDIGDYSEDEIIRAGFFETIKTAYGYSIYCVRMVVESVKGLFTMSIKMDEMAGPIGVGQIVNDNLQAAAQNEQPLRASFVFCLNIAVLLSANLAVLNLLPIPALDGGRILFLLIEGIRRKPMDPEKEGWIHFAGFALIMIFAVFVAFNDILRIFN